MDAKRRRGRKPALASWPPGLMAQIARELGVTRGTVCGAFSRSHKPSLWLAVRLVDACRRHGLDVRLEDFAADTGSPYFHRARREDYLE